MTRDKILNIAREAGIEVHPHKEIARMAVLHCAGMIGEAME